MATLRCAAISGLVAALATGVKFGVEDNESAAKRLSSAFERRSRAAAPAPLNDNFIYLDNGIIRLGVDQSRGGALGYLSLSSSQQNLLNHHDFGRLVQGSFYSGPNPFDTPDHRCDGSSWDPWPWNPIGGGDAFNHSAILRNVTQLSATELIVVSTPYQWACNNVPCECNFTQTISLVGNAVEVQLVLTNGRTNPAGHAQYSMTQELPAIYIIGEYCHLFTVNASDAWGSTSPVPGPVEVPATWPWSNYRPSQRWMAFANSSDPATAFAVGVWTPFFTNVGAGRYFSSPPLACGGQASDDPTGYIAPWTAEVLDWNINYPYNFSLVLGTLGDIQSYALGKHAAGMDDADAPQYVFGPESGRAHCTFGSGLVDGGWPVPSDGLVIPLNASNGVLVGPFASWMAQDVPAVYINGSWPTVASGGSSTTTIAVLFMQWGENDPCATCYVLVEVPATSTPSFQVVKADLSSNPAYSGRIGRVGLRPSITAQAGQVAQIKSITAQPPQAE